MIDAHAHLAVLLNKQDRSTQRASTRLDEAFRQQVLDLLIHFFQLFRAVLEHGLIDRLCARLQLINMANVPSWRKTSWQIIRKHIGILINESRNLRAELVIAICAWEDQCNQLVLSMSTGRRCYIAAKLMLALASLYSVSTMLIVQHYAM